MTTQRLRDLMEERVADVETDDLATRAWARADGVRRRRRIAVIGTAAAAVLVVAGGVAVLDDRPSATNAPTDRRHDERHAHDGPAGTDVRRTRVRRSPASSVARRSGGRRRPSRTRDSRCSQVPGLPDQLVDGRRGPGHDATGPRGRGVRHGQAAVPRCSATTGSCRSTCRTGSVRWPTRAATRFAR